MRARSWIAERLGWRRPGKDPASEQPAQVTPTADAQRWAQAAATRQETLQWITHSRWFIIDQLEKQQPPPMVLQCPICDCRRAAGEFGVFESYCQFGGGRLLRRSCPGCGVVFGPAKVMRLNEDELAQEYRLLYLTYSEADTTEHELCTFEALRPRKNGIYLNYGSGGGWNSTITKLRNQGWNVFGFEPYSTTQSEFIIRSLGQLRQMKFDGIMSNNVMEHLQDPVATFRQWASLLKSPQSLMAHSTPCYDYRFEYTRFHLFFFTGRSLDALCARTGFRAHQVARNADYICFRFAPLPNASALNDAA